MPNAIVPKKTHTDFYLQSDVFSYTEYKQTVDDTDQKLGLAHFIK